MGHLTGEPKPFQHGKLHSEKKQNPEISLCQLHTQSHLTTSARSPTYPTSGTNSRLIFPPRLLLKKTRERGSWRKRESGGRGVHIDVFAGRRERGRKRKRERKTGAAKTEFQRPWLLTANVQYTSSHYLHCQASLPRYRAAGAGVATDQTNSTSGGWRGEQGGEGRKRQAIRTRRLQPTTATDTERRLAESPLLFFSN